jgi:hypothetical protein
MLSVALEAGPPGDDQPSVMSSAVSIPEASVRAKKSSADGAENAEPQRAAAGEAR